MKPWILLPLSICVAIPTSALLSGSTGSRGHAIRMDQSADPSELRSALDELLAENAALTSRVSALRDAHPSEAPADVEGDEIRTAVVAWLTDNALEERVLDQPLARLAPPTPSPAAGLSMEQLLEFFGARQAFGDESTFMYDELRKSGRMDEFVSSLEALAAANPNDPEIQTSLGMAYLQQLFGLGPSPEAGMVATQADAAFDRAIELDPNGIEARFTKAVSLANWPEFMGKTDEAIRHFEIVRNQAEEGGTAGSLTQLYLFLGNMYLRIGEHDRALATWQAGLNHDPTDAVLAQQIELNAPPERDAPPGDR